MMWSYILKLVVLLPLVCGLMIGCLYAWRKLETRLKQQLSAAIAREGHEPRESWLAKLIGGGAAAAAAPLPWRWELKVLAALIKVTVPAFERFERKFAERDPELARDLLAHERAQLEFFLRELDGDEQASLEPVESLLDSPK